MESYLRRRIQFLKARRLNRRVKQRIANDRRRARALGYGQRDFPLEAAECRPETGRVAIAGQRKTRSKKYLPVPPCKNVIVFAPGRIAIRCAACNGVGMIFGELGTNSVICRACDGSAFLGIDSHSATSAMPGTEEKVSMMVARYQAGIPLWNPADRVEFSDDEEKALKLIPRPREIKKRFKNEITIHPRTTDDQASAGPRTNNSDQQGPSEAGLLLWGKRSDTVTGNAAGDF
jgi:LSD1 subclass zinc finger protein